MVSVNMLDTGFDCPEVVNLVMARFTKSQILYRQMRGRGTRRADHIKKTNFTIFDFVGNVDFHGDSEERAEGGFVIVAKPPKEEARPRALLVLDVDDHIDPASRTWITLDDQGNPARPSNVEERSNELGMRFEGWLLEQELEPEQERLLKMVGEQIKANAATLDGFGLERFVNPPFSFRGGLDHAITVFGGLEQLGKDPGETQRGRVRTWRRPTGSREPYNPVGARCRKTENQVPQATSLDGQPHRELLRRLARQA